MSFDSYECRAYVTITHAVFSATFAALHCNFLARCNPAAISARYRCAFSEKYCKFPSDFTHAPFSRAESAASLQTRFKTAA